MSLRLVRSVYLGIGWTVLFAIMSFYWASGGLVGTKSLGGEIYQKALTRDQEFASLVWATGIVKLAGVLFLSLLVWKRVPARARKWVAYGCNIAGIFMILYGLGNFITISLAAFHVLQFDLSAYATKWRLLFWEPFWVAGGILYLLAGTSRLKLDANE